VCYWRDELNVAHALPSYYRSSYLDSALVTDNTFISDTLVLSAVTFVVALRAEDLFVEKSVLFRTLGAVVDGLWLGDLAT
jgi:hypothetical protein